MLKTLKPHIQTSSCVRKINVEMYKCLYNLKCNPKITRKLNLKTSKVYQETDTKVV